MVTNRARCRINVGIQPRAPIIFFPSRVRAWFRHLQLLPQVGNFHVRLHPPRCGFSRKIVALLQEQKVELKHFDIPTDHRKCSPRYECLLLSKLYECVILSLCTLGLKVLPTFPQLIVNGELVGGLDIAQEMANNGELQEMLKS